MLLSDKSMQDAIERGDISFDPAPPESAFEPASVDLAIGREAYVAGSGERTRLDEGEILRLDAGVLAIVLTREALELGNNIAAAIGLKSHYTRQGIDLLAGPQIDPGFNGPLHLTLINLSPSPISLSEGDQFCTVEFHQLSEPVEAGYDGEYQMQYRITAEEINDLEDGGYTLSELHQSMSNISQNVSKIEENIDRMEKNHEELNKRVRLHMVLLTSILAALVAAIIGNIIGFF